MKLVYPLKKWVLNGIKEDNRPENLVAMKAGEHIHQVKPYQKRIKELEDALSKM